MCGTRHEAGEHRSYAVPVGVRLDDRRKDVVMGTHEFNGDLGVVQQVGALEDDTERTLADLLADAVVHADDVG